MEPIPLHPTPIAIIGVAGIFPQAHNVQEYWDNILHKIDCITDVPPSRWNIEDYYDPDPSAPDKTYAKRGGFIPDIIFDPLEFGLPPNILEVTDVSQLLALVVARDLIADAGYGNGRAFDRSRVGVILGVAGGQKLITSLASRLQYPVWRKVLLSSGIPEDEVERIIEKIKLAYVPWNEDSFPGLLGNVIAGRVANRFDLGGTNCTVDAACASSLGAVKMAISELIEGRADMMITGGVDTDNSPFMYLCFSKTPALSRQGQTRPFDADADGMLVGEGVGMLLLKRLADAERDGDRVYAVIKGIGTSSDGRFKCIYAPRPEGQALALRRAYADAGFAPTDVGLIEAHGTGTRAGDPAEFEGLRSVFVAPTNEPTDRSPHIALGSVKSQIGHTKAAAGAAGLIKAALALHHKVLPPTLNITHPNPQLGLEESPFYLNTESRPWIRANGTPRRAGVSAFGFGGTNFHVVLEEYTADHSGAYRLHHVAQPVLLYADTPAKLRSTCESALTALTDAADVTYADLTAHSRAPQIPADAARLGFVADSPAEVADMLRAAIATLERQPDADAWEHPKGVTYRRQAIPADGKVVALFPGQGSQYLNMGREIALNFPPLRAAYGQMDALFAQAGMTPLSAVVFPIPVFDAAQEKAQEAALGRTAYAQAAIGVFSAGLFNLLRQAGFAPDFAAGHSFGELSALWAGGVLDDADFFALVKARGQAMTPPDKGNGNGGTGDAGGMVAVKGALSDIQAALAPHSEVIIANFNAPTQSVLAGPTAALKAAQADLRAQGFTVTPLSVAAAFHTPLMAHAAAPFAQAVAAATFHPARFPVYSNTTGQPYPADTQAAKEVLAQHILHPVLFTTQIENLYAAGGRLFVEIGPRRVVTGLVDDILGDRPHIAVALNPSRQKCSDRQLREAVVQLQIAGLALGDVDPYQI
ncbi:MAG TPA: beta-ketoacyl synthase N-terminal-like domain-containing protein [Anaerolineae bacterium]|nr:beta-ketoacyl synthase N-terminal-like domain-containing protein [Anaerolineae bacterium]HQH39000.1 beta-ketoacyl synthase N-terminal-like domain-containing protein [Anaerolineae bacterium]